MAQPLRFDPIEEAGRQWREHWGAAPAASMVAATSVMRAQQILLARLNEALDPFHLSFARYEALLLLYLSSAGSLPLGKLGARLQVHPATVTSLIDGLERARYVHRAPHPTDRRTTLATITTRGREIAATATDALNAISFGTAPLRPSELRAVSEALKCLRLGAGDFREEQ